MNSKNKKDGGRFQFLGRQRPKMRVPRFFLIGKQPGTLRRRRAHDPMLVFNMSIFNLDDGWSRVFEPFKVHENGAR